MKKLTREEVEKLVRHQLKGLVERQTQSTEVGVEANDVSEDPLEQVKGKLKYMEEQEETDEDNIEENEDMQDGEGRVYPGNRDKKKKASCDQEVSESQNPFKRLCEVAHRPYGSYRGDK